jgi:hydroxyacylglutathione hydrolase
VIETPGHTAGHICYYLPEDKLLFSADTLFALGCGRLFERLPATCGPRSQAAELPEDTTVYFGHEYTMSNARFAVTIDPRNDELLDACPGDRIAACRRQVYRADDDRAGTRTNPFLRANDPDIRKHLGMEGAEDWEVFAEIRSRKDKF